MSENCKYWPYANEKDYFRPILATVKNIEKRLNEDECIKHKIMVFLDSPNDLSMESNFALRKLIGLYRVKEAGIASGNFLFITLWVY